MSISQENLIAEEIIKIRGNKVLAQYLEDTAQWMRVDPVTKEIYFLENKMLRPNYILGKDKGWGCLVKPIRAINSAQLQFLPDGE